ncbi:methyltransferase [Porphyrobacter algicida]|uniref:Ribosomal protein L11 methyltransferase n=1 Tax=Qipengyuania algicida TaxID=1836209 RepID=A0A845AKC8_9SPHN|nr:50S ribosomal protein L11 methyltransferase [Qipengyuania algicida]MXP28996.1 methyltransferase [Qipengyuania algicida]
MADSWKITGFASKAEVQAALLAHDEVEEWDFDMVIAGREVAEDRLLEWVIEVWLPREPTAADKRAVAALFADRAPELSTEKLPPTDWVIESQKGVDPINAGPFHVRTPEHPASDDAVNLVIPASQAFGTGQHATTAGCLAMLALMRREGVMVRNAADIGTGTGLLALGALRLWPRALMTVSDIDPICVGVVEDNAALNGATIGAGRGEMLMVVTDGMADPVLKARGPYDLLIANILARPLIELAPDFGKAVSGGGHIVLAGLLATQEHAVRSAYRRAGFRLARRLVNGDWSILWLRKRR